MRRAKSCLSSAAKLLPVLSLALLPAFPAAALDIHYDNLHAPANVSFIDASAATSAVVNSQNLSMIAKTLTQLVAGSPPVAVVTGQ